MSTGEAGDLVQEGVTGAAGEVLGVEVHEGAVGEGVNTVGVTTAPNTMSAGEAIGVVGVTLEGAITTLEGVITLEG